ncbi:MAG: tripartite tricarboxylate transporter TctB family protein [Desulfobulbaceae bacterium]|nr:MAG: tripartite tricarboxylate transporter TctB family protein [Desulfobulbaceae bacterium]
MSDQSINPARDTGGMVMACVFILIASISLWDTTNMMDSDSYVFPRAIAIAMIVMSLFLIIWNIVRPAGFMQEEHQKGSAARRIFLVAVMLLSCLVMPWLGFLISGIVTFGLLMLVSMYDPWTRGRKIVYPLVAGVIVVGFYTLFSKLLLVPLPVGLLFE